LVRVKGKNEPVAIFEPCGEELALEEAYRQDILKFNDMVAAYRKQDWTAADSMLQELVAHKPNRKLYRYYLDRVASYRQNPPSPEWDGVCIFTTK
jgi:adenylate cyclase